jgi:hypothetical protein
MAVRCQPYAPAAFYPPGRFLVLISVRGWVDPRAIVQLEGLKKSTLSGTWTGDLPVCSPRLMQLLIEMLWVFSFLSCFLHDIPTASSHFNNEHFSMLYARDVQDLTLWGEFPSESWIYFSSSGEICGSSSGPLFTTFHQMTNQIITTVPETMICSSALLVIFSNI